MFFLKVGPLKVQENSPSRLSFCKSSILLLTSEIITCFKKPHIFIQSHIGLYNYIIAVNLYMHLFITTWVMWGNYPPT